MRIAIVLLCVLLPAAAAAHGGGLDRNGGHRNRKTGEYHCHREPCFSRQQKPGPTKATPAKAKKPKEKPDDSKPANSGE